MTNTSQATATRTSCLVILFADISGSTRLYETLGDQKAQTLVSETLEFIASIARRFSGNVIKTIGDEIMCTFKLPADAVTAACAMNELLEDLHYQSQENPPLSIRVGLHHGPAIVEGGDIFGDAVNIAARITAQSKSRQILTTRPTIDHLPSLLRTTTRFVDHCTVKGKKEEIEIFEVIWQQEGLTRMSTELQAEHKAVSHAKLWLNYLDQQLLLDQMHPSVVIGRSQSCDLSINETLASRQHVRIELRRDKFYIIDQSTNGTYLCLNDNSDIFLRREEMPLPEAGSISLGRVTDDNPDHLVFFRLENP